MPILNLQVQGKFSSLTLS